MAGFSPAEIASLEEMFKHYDKDASGDIDSVEAKGEKRQRTPRFGATRGAFA